MAESILDSLSLCSFLKKSFKVLDVLIEYFSNWLSFYFFIKILNFTVLSLTFQTRTMALVFFSWKSKMVHSVINFVNYLGLIILSIIFTFFSKSNSLYSRSFFFTFSVIPLAIHNLKNYWMNYGIKILNLLDPLKSILHLRIIHFFSFYSLIQSFLFHSIIQPLLILGVILFFFFRSPERAMASSSGVETNIKTPPNSPSSKVIQICTK